MTLVPIIKELFDLIVTKDIGYNATLLTIKEKPKLNVFENIKTYRYFLLDNTYPIVIQIEEDQEEGVVFTPNNLPKDLLESLVDSIESRKADTFLTMGDWELVKVGELDPENDYLLNNYTTYMKLDCDNRLDEGVYKFSYPKYSFVKEFSIKKIPVYGDPENMIAYENKFNAFPEREYNRSLCWDYISLITLWANRNYGAS